VIKQAPSLGRTLTMVLFAVSCFVLLLYLWLSFGGTVPLKPKGYRVHVLLPADNSTRLGIPADVRTAGVTVGRIVAKEQVGNGTLATVELQAKYAPLRSDAKAIVRFKTLQGETYLSLTRGSPDAPSIPEGGRLRDAQVDHAVQLDQILTAFDERTRRAFQTWQQDLARGLVGRGADVNAALGQLPAFTSEVADATDVLAVHEDALRGLVRDTGTVLGSLSSNQAALRRFVTGSEAVVSQTSREREALADAISIFPTFLDESRATLADLRTFSAEADPLVKLTIPVLRDAGGAVRAGHVLAPDLRRLFVSLRPLQSISRTALPAAASLTRASADVLRSLGPVLGELNPVLDWLQYHARDVSDFIVNTPSAMVAKTDPGPGGGPGHYLRVTGVTGPESLGLQPTRSANSRGNAYVPAAVLGKDLQSHGIIADWDCAPAGGETKYKKGFGGHPACFVAPRISLGGKTLTRYPHIERRSG
jgi:phospholipid/cholesterol/gamma-HCH transport system substrate-binding protein